MPQASAPSTPYDPEPTEDFYLWHLKKIGVLDDQLKSGLWDTACAAREKVAVAIIDTGIDTGHPNLNSGHADCPWPQIDFTPHLYGARYVPPLKSVKLYLEARSRREPLASDKKMSELRNAVCDELGQWSKRLGLDIGALNGTLKPQGADDTDFYKALMGTPGLSGFAEKGARTPGPTLGELMLPHPTELGMQKMQAIIDSLGNDDIDDAIKDLWIGLQDKMTINIPGEDPSRYFGAHGTACAGLIGGRPALTEENITENPTAPKSMAYFGVNPFCKLLPISTPYSHEVLPMIHALIYAVARGAQVIHMPRGLPDYVDRNWKMKDTHFRTRIDRHVGIVETPDKPKHLGGIPDDVWYAAEVTEAEKLAIKNLAKGAVKAERDASLLQDQADLFRLMLHSKMFERLLKATSHVDELYVVLSAGNDGWSNRLSYPARVHEPKGKTKDNLIVVGAVNRWAYDRGKNWFNHISSYSNGRKGYADLGIYHALSDDGFALDQDRIAYDERGRDANDYSYEPHLPLGIANGYSDWGLLTLDVRGSYGYAAGRRYDPPEYDDGEELGALYTLFGGTSGASALVAGAISLLLQAKKKVSLAELFARGPIKL